MWEKVKTLSGVLWAGPVTLPGLLYTLAFQAMGWHRFHGVSDDALVWVLDLNKCPGWLKRLWQGWGGHTIGNVIVLKESPDAKDIVLSHEKRHVLQCMRLGVFQPILYGLNMLAIWVACPDSDMYYGNPFEIDARRAAGQIVDIEGLVRKAKAKASVTPVPKESQ